MRNVSHFKLRFKTCLKIISAFSICLIFFLSAFVFTNYKSAFADSERDGNTVKAGVFKFEGYHDRADNGNLSGYGIEFLNLVSKYSDINFEYTGYDKEWDDMLPMLENGKIDVVTSASKTEDREEKFDFSLPIGRRKTVLSIRVGDTAHRRGEYDTYNGMKVGLVEGSSQNDDFKAFKEEKGFDCEEITAKADELAVMLQKGEIDAILSSNLRKATNEKELEVIKEADFYAIVKKGDPKGLLPQIDDAIRQMDIDEGDWQNTLFYKYYGPGYSSELSFSAREKAYIDKLVHEGKIITVTASGDRAPYSYTEGGELKGIMPDYFAELMKLAGLKENYRFVASDDDTANVTLDSTGEDDVIEDVVKGCFKTNSYMTARMARVTRQDHKGDIKVVAVAKSQGEDIIDQKTLEGCIVKSYNTGDEALRAVLSREADAAYVYAYTAQWFINHDHTNSLYYSSVNGMSTSFSMHVSENTDHELVTILNKCIKQMSDDALNQLAAKYTSYSIGDVSFWQYIQANPAIIIAIVVVLAVVVFVILVLLLRGRWNRKLLLATEQSNKKMGEQLSIVEALSREYTNVYSVDEEKATAQILKLEGYVAEGLKKGSAEEYNYGVILENYIRARVYPDDREELLKALSLDTVKEKLSVDNEYQGSYRIEDNGEIHHLQYTYLKIVDKEHEHGGFILAGFRNIDEVIRKEQEQKDALSEALAQAQYANKSKTTFLNSMSHDIRTPMNAIIGFTSLAEKHLDDKEQIHDYLGKIMTSGNHLLSLINDVLDMSRIESGKVKIEEKETSLPEIMHDLNTIVQADVKAKQLKFGIDTDVTNETIICDKLRLNQVLLNIISNAVKYTKAGGTVGVRVIQKANAPKGYAYYEFKVKDTGIGMSPQFLQHVFEPFEREQTATVSGIQGTGLGLAITKNLVDMMGGTITVESEQGKGSEFTVTFCFRVAENAAANSKEREGEDKGEMRFDGKKILLVEDNELNQEIAQSILEDVGFIIDTADDGSIAVERMKEKPAGTYDLILMDVQMPIMNGYEATKAIRALDDKAKAATPIVAMTANAFDEDRKAAMDAGMDGFASKPIDIAKLMNTLKDILK
ncbi:MAG: transporter substrate-binding domain-containing protein [Clostridia bacterium]|nr:transporter substrate-binding domain-containing protein [Clostridia bacterium]